MAWRDEVKIREGRIDELVKIYKAAYLDVITTIVTATEAGKIRKAQTMVAINRILEDLGVDVAKWVQEEIPQYYLTGSNDALDSLRSLGVEIDKSNMTLINREAIAAFTDEVSLAFAEGIRGISRNARKVLDDALKQQINSIIAQGKLQGQAVREISRSVEQRLRVEGLGTLVDRGGREWKFDTYSDMLVRTKGVEARNYGLQNRMLANGYYLVQVSNTGTSHKACQVWQGKILTLDEQKYPVGTVLPGGYKVAGTYDQAKRAGLFHPNCQHAINVFRPSLAAKTKAYDNPFNRGPLTS